MPDENVHYDITKMESDYYSAKRTIWNAWIEVHKRELTDKHGIDFEQAVLCLANDIESRRKIPTDEMVEKCIKDISDDQVW